MSVALFTVEVRDVADKMTAFFGSLANYFITKTGTPPSFEDTAKTFKTDQAEGLAQEMHLGSNGYASGAISSALYDNASLQRESLMCLTTKSEFYSMEASEFASQANRAQADVARKLNYIQGKSPEQGITV